MSQFTVQRTILIKRAIEDVFAFVADPLNDRRWCPAVSETEQLEGDGPGLGARYRYVHTPGFPTLEARSEITAYNPPREMEILSEDKYHTLRVSYRLESANSATRLTQTSNISVRGFKRLMTPVSKFFVDKELEKQFQHLKEVLESQEEVRRAAWRILPH